MSKLIVRGIGSIFREQIATHSCHSLSCRRYHTRKWLEEVTTRFQGCGSLPNYGKSLEWPKAPVAIKVLNCSTLDPCQLPCDLGYNENQLESVYGGDYSGGVAMG